MGRPAQGDHGDEELVARGEPSGAEVGVEVAARGQRDRRVLGLVGGEGGYSGSTGIRNRARSAWSAWPSHCPTAVSRSWPVAVIAHTACGDQARQRVDQAVRGAGSASNRAQAACVSPIPSPSDSTARVPARNNVSPGTPRSSHRVLDHLHDFPWRARPKHPMTCSRRPSTEDHLKTVESQLRRSPGPCKRRGCSWSAGRAPDVPGRTACACCSSSETRLTPTQCRAATVILWMAQPPRGPGPTSATSSCDSSSADECVHARLRRRTACVIPTKTSITAPS